jgi:hypothetical protein
VLLQNFSPEHPVMAASADDFEGFLAPTSEQRRPGHWPPSAAGRAIVSAEEAAPAERAARDLGLAARWGGIQASARPGALSTAAAGGTGPTPVLKGRRAACRCRLSCAMAGAGESRIGARAGGRDPVSFL